MEGSLVTCLGGEKEKTVLGDARSSSHPPVERIVSSRVYPLLV